MNVSVRNYQIPEAVQGVLASATCKGTHLVITAKLDRGLYVETNKVLEAIGGKWNRKVGAHVFDDDPSDVIEQAVNNGTYTKEKQDYGVFYTPEALAKRVVDLADIQPMMRVLEPSAGEGVLAREARAKGAVVNCVEMRGLACGHLRAQGFSTIEGDFLELKISPSFDRVVMNPPFAKRADIAHITRAFNLLVPGGKLVSIASASVRMRDDSLAKEFRALVLENGGSITDLPDGSFKESGSMVRTSLVTMQKPQ